MSKIANESRRAITEDEKQRGLEWLKNNELAYNFGDFTECEEAVSNALKEAGANHILDVIFCEKKQ